MAIILVILVVFPFLVAVASLALPSATSRYLTIFAGAATFALSLPLVPAAADHAQVAAGSFLRVDAISVVFVVATTFLYGATGMFAAGYLHLAEGSSGRRAFRSRPEVRRPRG